MRLEVAVFGHVDGVAVGGRGYSAGHTKSRESEPNIDRNSSELGIGRKGVEMVSAAIQFDREPTFGGGGHLYWHLDVTADRTNCGLTGNPKLTYRLRRILLLVGLLVCCSTFAIADTVPIPVIRATVVKAAPECSNAFLVSGPTGYQIVEWMAGDVPLVGEVMEGVIWPWVKWVGYVDSTRKTKIWVHTTPDSKVIAEQKLKSWCDIWVQ